MPSVDFPTALALSPQHSAGAIWRKPVASGYLVDQLFRSDQIDLVLGGLRLRTLAEKIFID